MTTNKEHLDRLVSRYVDEIMRPGIPYVSSSHATMRAIYGVVGVEKGDARIKREMERQTTPTSSN